MCLSSWPNPHRQHRPTVTRFSSITAPIYWSLHNLRFEWNSPVVFGQYNPAWHFNLLRSYEWTSYMYICVFDLVIRGPCYSPADPHFPFPPTCIISSKYNIAFLISTTFEMNAKLEHMRIGFWKCMLLVINLIESVKGFGWILDQCFMYYYSHHTKFLNHRSFARVIRTELLKDYLAKSVDNFDI